MASAHHTSIIDALHRLSLYVEQTEWRGYDPFDALNSPVVKALSFNQKWLRVAWTQLFRRSPVNLRPLFLTRKGMNPKGLGLFLSAVIRQFQRTGDQKYKIQADQLINLIESHCIQGYAGPCWGYNFDWQNTKFLFEKGTPTLVNTSVVCDALLDAYEEWGDRRHLETARKACTFVLTDLHRTVTEQGICFSYTPEDASMVYNASILGGRLLARVGRITGNQELISVAAQTVSFLLSRQRDDGSWSYGEWQMQQHIDSYHTGFNLEALADIHRFLPDLKIEDAMMRGLNFYMTHLFKADGFPKFLSDQDYPVDIHNISALIPLVKCARYRNNDLDLKRISSWFIREMQGRGGQFYFRKGRHWINKTPFIRWGQAWAYLSLSIYAQHLKGQEEETQ